MFIYIEFCKNAQKAFRLAEKKTQTKQPTNQTQVLLKYKWQHLLSYYSLFQICHFIIVAINIPQRRVLQHLLDFSLIQLTLHNFIKKKKSHPEHISYPLPLLYVSSHLSSPQEETLVISSLVLAK